MNHIQFYYDVTSPYSWFAFETLERLRKPWNLDVELMPVLLGGIFKTSGNSSPAFNVAKAPYSLKDITRQSTYFSLPITIPDCFPANSLKAMRLLTFVKQEMPGLLSQLSRGFWHRLYQQGLDISQESDVIAVLQQADLLPAQIDTLLANIQNEAIKDKLKEATEQAVARGTFGVPTMFALTPQGSEMFFGSDRFHHLASALNVAWHDPLTALWQQ